MLAIAVANKMGGGAAAAAAAAAESEEGEGEGEEEQEEEDTALLFLSPDISREEADASLIGQVGLCRRRVPWRQDSAASSCLQMKFKELINFGKSIRLSSGGQIV